jgi:NTE family protein
MTRLVLIEGRIMSKIGLALGGGAARGLAHIGVLKVLEEMGIKPDVIAGTSIGAVIGATYASGKSAKEIEDIVLGLNWGKRALLFWDVTVPRTGLLRGRRIENFLKHIIGDVEFSDLKLPFACVATDLMSGKEVIMDDGPVVEALRASMAIPAIFTPLERDGLLLVDGGLRHPVPTHAARRLGADFVIAVNVEPDARRMASVPREKRKSGIPNIYDVIMQTVSIVSYQRVRGSLRRADVAIEPRTEDIGFGDFQKARECIARGEEAARAVLGRAGLVQT